MTKMEKINWLETATSVDLLTEYNWYITKGYDNLFNCQTEEEKEYHEDYKLFKAEILKRMA